MMRKAPNDALTAAQLNVMEALWACGPDGGYAYDIWQQAGGEDAVARTTILTVIQRLEERGWIRRSGSGRKLRYHATRNREETLEHLSNRFVRDYFGGSASQLVMSLLGSEKLDETEIRQLRTLLDAQEDV